MSKKTGYVYLLGDWEKEHMYKIGVTTGSIERRIKKLQTGNSSEIYLVKYYETEHPFFTEARLHQRFHKEKVLNEWFELSDDDVKNFKKYCDDIEEIVKAMKNNPFFPKNLK